MLTRKLAMLNAIAQHPSNSSARLRSVLYFLAWRARCRFANRPMTIPFVASTRLFVYETGASSQVLARGLFEYNDMIFAMRYLRKEDTAVDVGANDGVFTVLFAAYSGRVHAIEPHPESYRRLLAQLTLNGLSNAVPHEAAVGEASGEVWFTNCSDSTENRVQSTSTEGAHRVRLARLAELVNEPAALVKVDVEGLELSVLRGAGQLKQCPVWIVEVNGRCRDYGVALSDIYDAFADAGYAPHAYTAATSELTPVPRGTEVHGGNVLFIRSVASVSARLAEVQSRPALARPAWRELFL